MNDILNQLLKIKQKINAINTIQNKKLKNLARSHKPFNEDMENKAAKSIGKTKKTKYRLKLLNNNTNNLESINKDENNFQDYKTVVDFNCGSKNKESTKNSVIFPNKNQKYKLRLSLDEINKEKSSENSETLNSSKKEISKSIDKSSISYNYHYIKHQQAEQANYIDKIRNDEFICLYNKFKKSMKKCKKEEICHQKSLVFPVETVDYIIKMKNEFIIDKYRNEYLKRFDNYKFNKQNILKVIKNCKKNEMENSEININKSDIKKYENNDNKKEYNKNNESNSTNVDDKFNYYF